MSADCVPKVEIPLHGPFLCFHPAMLDHAPNAPSPMVKLTRIRPGRASLQVTPSNPVHRKVHQIVRPPNGTHSHDEPSVVLWFPMEQILPSQQRSDLNPLKGPPVFQLIDWRCGTVSLCCVLGLSFVLDCGCCNSCSCANYFTSTSPRHCCAPPPPPSKLG